LFSRDTTPRRIAAFASGDNRSQNINDGANVELFVGSNARWLVDKRRRVVSALSLETETPLWSRNGVVFQANPLATSLSQDVAPAKNGSPAPEFFGRVYFFLDDDATLRFGERPRVFADALLVALDPLAQGRLVWKLRAQDFAPFFPTEARQNLRFLPKIRPLPNDELLVQVLSEKETKHFALNAATGLPRPLATFNISR
jgi:hypothetical protein